MAGELRIHRRPELTRPVLIAAFRGWNDGAQAASLAAGYLAKTWQAGRFADVDPEGFFDFQATRPHVSLEGGMTRKIDWPETAFYHARPDGFDRDVVLLLGIEPNLRWRTFTDLLVGLVRELGVEMMITLGALLADVPHTRSSPVTGSASDPELVRQLGLSESRYENAIRSSPSRRTRTGLESRSGSSVESRTGCQYWRSISPIGVAGPTRHRSSLSSFVSISFPSPLPLGEAGVARERKPSEGKTSLIRPHPARSPRGRGGFAAPSLPSGGS